MSKLRTLANGAIGTGLGFFLSGCEPAQITQTTYSDVMQEKGYVVDTLHNDGHHESNLELEPRYDLFGEDGFNIALTTKEIRIPEIWGVVFRCEHNKKFAIDGSDDKYKLLWEKLDPGMEVTIDYREVHRDTLKDLDGDGKRDLVSRELIDFDFIDANPIRK